MINGIIGKKVGMTQLFAPDGAVTPVTVIKAGPCVVVQKKTAGGRDGYDAVQLGLVEDKPIKLKNVTKPLRGHFEKTGGGLPPTRVLKEFRLVASDESTNVGDKILVDQFADGDIVDVVGTSKGRGFAGTIKRHNFNRGPESHGSMNVRAPGSIGASAYPSRVVKGMRSSGHMGDVRVTTKRLTVARVTADNNLLMICGAVPRADCQLALATLERRRQRAWAAAPRLVVQLAQEDAQEGDVRRDF